MRILYKTTGTLSNFEAKVDLKLDRSRNDFKTLLTEINSGKKIDTIFKSIAISNSIEKILKNKGFIDASGKLTKSGKDFINNPRLEEIESGTYSIDHVALPIGIEIVHFFSAMRRTISNEKRASSQWYVQNLLTQNQFVTDRKDEIVYFKEVSLPKQLKSVFKGEDKSTEINVNLVEKTYSIDKGTWLDTGDNLYSKVLSYAYEVLKKNPYGRFDLVQNLLYIDSLKDFSDQELVIGELDRYSYQGIEVSKFPLCIDNVAMAKQYAYLYMYYRLKDDAIYSFKEMDEIFQNEVLTKNIFTESVKQNHLMLEFQYDYNGFKDNLSADKFNNLSYKLRVLEEFLDLTIVDNEFSRARNYSDIVNKFKTTMSGSSVHHLYMVMGYPFAKNAKTKTREMIEAFKKEYANISIVKKGNEQQENAEIENDVRKMGVLVKENSAIKSAFHDRYLVFELENKTFEVYLVTCEIGQFFNPSTNQPLGSIFKVNTHEITKENRNLIQLVKE